MLFPLLRSNSGQPAHSRAAQNAHKNGFGLVVKSVRCRNRVGVALTNQFSKPLVPQVTSGSLQAQLMIACVRRHIRRT